MSTKSLTVLREQSESPRLRRLKVDDSRGPRPGEGTVDALRRALKEAVHGEVRFDSGTRALYATDSSNFRQAPIGVVIPRHAEDVRNTIDLCRQHGAPILSRGGGTSLAGQCCNVAVVMDFSKYMNRVRSIDPQNRLAHVEPGCVLDDLRGRAIERYGLNFGPDPETHSHCTLGGMLGNNSCGVHSHLSQNHGLGVRTSDNTHALKILTYRGLELEVGPTSEEDFDRIIQSGGQRGALYRQLRDFRDRYANAIRQGFPRLERRVSGYNLPDLLPENGCNLARALVGSESTLVTYLEATLYLVPEPGARTLVILGYPDIATGAEHTMEILEHKPTGLEGIDHLLFKFVKEKGQQDPNLALFPPGGGFLLVEFGGDSQKEANDKAHALMNQLKDKYKSDAPTMQLYDDKKQQTMVWKVREGSLGSTAWVPSMPDTWEGWEDSAVPVPKIADYLRDLRKLLDKYDYHPTLYGHLGQGCVHTRVPFDLYTAEGIEKWRSFIGEAVDLVVSYGGSLSGEHGDGQSRGEWLPRMFNPTLMQAMHDFKRIWDPDNRMNPGKMINLDGKPYAMTQNLRLGPDYNPPQPKTYFAFPADQHSFARASLRCVGVGECRRHGGGTMCPSYMVTREEKHSTRGRARMLFEMMNGEILEEGWKSQEVKEALDLCLSCKGCKGDCPVNVDMATYKAEFLAHYYEGRLRPRHAYAFGWIGIWARLASFAPTILNFFSQTPGLRSIAKFAAGMSPKRSIPPFAPQTFKDWFARRTPRNTTGDPVLLFGDTFNNFFHPDTAQAAVEVLEDAGFRVIVPMEHLCCGRPLYDYGFLNMARRWLLHILDILQPHIETGTPMVVLEPSCWAVFFDELGNLLPDHLDGLRLRENVWLLSEFLETKAPHYQPPKLHKHAILHRHCHHKSELKHASAQENLLRKMGVEFDEPELSCCGMAGAFGFEDGQHYDVAMACGEKALLPSVRQSTDETLLVADGFSCREQISQTTDRQALHIAQVIQLAKHHGENGPKGRPEGPMIRQKRAQTHAANRRTLMYLAAGAGAVIGAGLLTRAMRPRQGA